MKKVFKQGDGSFVTIEGTPEEIRQYERIVEDERSPKQKKAPEVIKGKEADPDASDAFRRLFEEIGKSQPKESGDRFPSWPQHPGSIWVTSCSLCHRNPCACRYFWDPTRIYCGPGVAVESVTWMSNGMRKAHTPFTHDASYGGLS